MVADDSDILALPSALIPEEWEMCTLKLGKNGTPPTIYSQNSLNEIPFCKKYILFLHAATGCDTTSCFFGRAKISIFNKWCPNRDKFYKLNFIHEPHLQ